MTCAELMECRVVLSKSSGSCSFLCDHGSCALGKEEESRIQPLPAGPQPPPAFASCLLPFSCCDPALESNTAFSTHTYPQHGMPFSHPLPVKRLLCLQGPGKCHLLQGAFLMLPRRTHSSISSSFALIRVSAPTVNPVYEQTRGASDWLSSFFTPVQLLLLDKRPMHRVCYVV